MSARASTLSALVANGPPPASTHDLASLISSTTSSTVYPSDDVLLAALQARFRADLPYTHLSSSGLGLVVVNPLRTLANLSDESSAKYETATKQPQPAAFQPHPYETAGRVWMAMKRTAKAQGVVYSGITGSGKTFTSRLLTAQILRLSARQKREQKLADQIKALDTVLDSFGSAKTTANSNASRYGRYLEMHFTPLGRIAAAKVLTFGLDKARVNAPLAHDERTFHVFYQLLAGATPDERDTLRLDDVTSYALLSSSGCYRLSGGPSSDDAIAMDDLRAAMKTLGFKPKHVHSIFSLLSAILLLGNITFYDYGAKDASYESARISNPAALADAAELLGITSEELEQVLTNRSRYVRKELCTVLLNADGAAAQRDALARDLYAILFAFVVETANHRVAPGADEDDDGRSSSRRIVQLDLPGFQTRPGGSMSAPSAGAQTSNAFDVFAVNYQAELLQSWLTRRSFDDASPANAPLVRDGLSLPEIVTMDNTACVELLRGTLLGTRADKKPGGVLGVLDKTCHRVRAGKASEDDDEALLTELDNQFAVHNSFVSSRSAGAGAESRPPIFGINHYSGSCSYDVRGFVERDLDFFDSAFVGLLRSSSAPFVAKLFSGPCLATEAHPLDENSVVAAQVSSSPLRRPSSTADGGEPSPAQPLLDSSKVYAVTRQLNSTLAELLAQIDKCGLVWDVLCFRPNDIAQPASFDVRRVKQQICAALLPDLVGRRRTEYVANLPFDQFCERYALAVEPAATAVGASTPKEKLQAYAIASAWRDGLDYAAGKDQVWLTYGAWRKLEDRLIASEPREDDVVVPYADEDGGGEDTAYPPLGGGRRGTNSSYFDGAGGDWGDLSASATRPGVGESADDLLLRRPSLVSDPFRTPFDGPPSEAGGAPSTIGWGESWNKRGAGGEGVSPGGGGGGGAGGMGGGYESSPLVNALEKDAALGSRMVVKERGPLDAVEEVPTSATRRWWVRFVWLSTWWIPSFLLSSLGGMKRPDVRLAWREKVTLCMLIFFACALVLFYILVFGKLLCPNFDKAWSLKEVNEHQGPDDYWVTVRGEVYDLTHFWRGQHSDDANLQTTNDLMIQLAGQDLTNYFPIPMTVGCPGLVQTDNYQLQIANDTYAPTVTQAIHSHTMMSGSAALTDENWYPKTFLPKMVQYHKGPLVYSKGTISQQADNDQRSWAIVNGEIFDLSNYIYTASVSTGSGTGVQDPHFIDSSISNLFQQQPGQDISKDYNAAMAALNQTTQEQVYTCLKQVFYVGKVDFRNSARCQVQNYLLLAFSIILVATLLAKFVAALQLSTKRMPEMQDKFVICQVPCYTEGEDSLRKTIDSLANLKYDDKRKLLFIICDGMIVGSGNDRPTPRIVLDILGVDPKVDPEPLMFKSVGEGSKQLNYGKVYSGLYEFEGHVVPYIVVVKVGKPSERSRPGNRGKRDTQILLMRYLNRVHFDSPMAPLELEMYHQMKNVIGIDPAFYEYILMVDADTSVEPDSLNRLVAQTADDSSVIGICGETKLDNEEGSWWTMIQVYEYYISHHLAKAFESLFGSVTCLPGCFSMYRIRTADKGRPVIISNRVIDDYSENHVDTLHKKNLLSLGEDRYLTTLILKHFPAFRTKFTADAIAHTAAPDRWGILLSQRRRWINSTVHNLAELVLMPELCGFCLFSMRFVVFLDLLGTIILPATVVYLVYLIVTVSTGKGQFPLISIVMIAAVYGLQAIIFLLKRQWQYIGWMIIYIIAYPVYSFFLPIYSFWHFDDFSWGNTRIVVGEKGNRKIVAGTDDEPYDDSMIPLKRFNEYEVATGSVYGGSSHPPSALSVSMPGLHSRAASTYSGGAGVFSSNLHLPPSPYAPGTPGVPTPPESVHEPVPSYLGPPPSGMLGMHSRPVSSYSLGMPMGMGMGNMGMGSMGSMGSIGMNPFAYNPHMPPASPHLPMSPHLSMPVSPATPTPNTAAAAAATTPSESTNPTDAELQEAVRVYLAAQPNLMAVTKRTAREAVMARFPRADLSARTAFLNAAIDRTLSGSGTG